MNKLKVNKEILVLLGVSILLILYIIFRSTGNMNYKLPEVDTYDPDTINHISIKGAKVDLDFVKTNGKWYIEPEKWEADKSNPDAIAKELAELNIADLISTSGNREVYNLDDDNKISVKAFIDNDLKREIFVGKVSSTSAYTYIQLPGNDNVYSIRGNIPSRIKDKKALRNKKFLSVERDSVNKLMLKGSDGIDITLSKDNTSGEWNSKDIEADNDKVKSALNILDPLRCVDFKSDTSVGAADWLLEIFTDEGASTLSIWKPLSDQNYTAKYSVNDYLVSVSSYSIEKILSAFGYSFD